MIDRKELQKVIKQETKELSKSFVFSDELDLTLKLSAKQIKNAFKPETDKNVMPHEFTAEFLTFLSDFRKYEVFDAESVSIELDSTCEKKYLDAFISTWKKHFAGRIVKQNADLKALRKKNIHSLFWGILSIIVFIGLQIMGVYIVNNATKIISICAEILLILCWVFLWSFFDDMIYKAKAEKAKLTDLYLSYAAKFIITSPKDKKIAIVEHAPFAQVEQQTATGGTNTVGGPTPKPQPKIDENAIKTVVKKDEVKKQDKSLNTTLNKVKEKPAEKPKQKEEPKLQTKIANQTKQ